MQCCTCGMFEVRYTVSGPAELTCGKCTHLQLLKHRVRELELELDELRIIWEAESVIDRSYGDVVTPRNEGRWVTVRRRGKKQSVQGSPAVVHLDNKYTILDTVGGRGPTRGKPTVTGSLALSLSLWLRRERGRAGEH